jgi:hypothetical protein
MFKKLLLASNPRAILLIIYLVPFVALLWFVSTFGVDVPQWDQWELVNLFKAVAEQRASFQDFFKQHNEHRLIFPKLIFTILAFSSNWSIKLEIYFNVLLAALLVLITQKIAFDQTLKHDRSLHLTGIFTSFLAFSFVQWENWLWGFQLSWFFINLCLAIAILALVNQTQPIWKKLLIAAVFCAIASFSLAYGLFTWLATLPTLITLWRTSRHIYQAVLLWIGLCLICALIYFWGYQKPAGHPDVFYFLQHPLIAANYFLTLLGSPMLHGSSFKPLLGLLVFVNFLVFVAWYLRHLSSKFAQDAAPWISFGLFALLFDLVTTIGRVGFGVSQAASPRYTSVSLLLLVALVQLWRLAWIHHLSKPNWFITPPEQVQKWCLVSGILALLVVLSSVDSVNAAKRLHSKLDHAKDCLYAAEYLSPSASTCLQTLYPNADLVRQQTKVLSQLGFRDIRSSLPFVAKPEKGYGYFAPPAMVAQNSVAQNSAQNLIRRNCLNCGEISVTGWAILPDRRTPANTVFLTYGEQPGTIFTTAPVNKSRSDVAVEQGNQYRRAGWSTRFSPSFLPLGNTVIKAWVYDPDNKQFVQLRGELKVRVEE